MAVPRAVLDTNVFVAAGFRRRSASATLVQRAREGAICLVWNEPTRAETRSVLERIPRLSFEAVEGLFTEGGHYTGPTRPEAFDFVVDAADRKFAALAAAAGVPVVSSDRHLLDHRDREMFEVRKPREMLALLDAAG
jgi:predicted nucleic acid-binding protein